MKQELVQGFIVTEINYHPTGSESSQQLSQTESNNCNAWHALYTNNGNFARVIVHVATYMHMLLLATCVLHTIDSAIILIYLVFKIFYI